MTNQFTKFLNDPKTIEAKAVLLQNLQNYQAQIQTVKAADTDLAMDYQKAIEEFSTQRGGALFFPYLASGLGRGCLVELADGSVKYDLINGIGVHHFGHSHPKVIEACLDAALSDTVMQGNLQQNAASAKFVKTILKCANQNGATFEHGFLSCTGVMAGENALKLAYQKSQPADRIFAFEKCFMGRTLAMSQFTDKAAYRQGLPLNCKVDYVPFFDANDAEGSTARALHAIQKQIKRYPGSHAAMSFELVLGEGGFYFGTPEFYKTLMTELKKHNIAILVDEVQSFARTSQLFAFQHFGLDELVDVVWFGKASQVCGTLYRATFKPKPGLLSQTFTGSTTAIAAGQVIVDTLMTENYFGATGKITALANEFQTRLQALAKKYPDRLSGPFGLGAMVAFTPFGGDADKTLKLVKALFQNGLICFNAGDTPARIRFLLPVGAVTQNDIEPIFKILETTLCEIN